MTFASQRSDSPIWRHRVTRPVVTDGLIRPSIPALFPIRPWRHWPSPGLVLFDYIFQKLRRFPCSSEVKSLKESWQKFCWMTLSENADVMKCLCQIACHLLQSPGNKLFKQSLPVNTEEASQSTKATNKHCKKEQPIPKSTQFNLSWSEQPRGGGRYFGMGVKSDFKLISFHATQ